MRKFSLILVLAAFSAVLLVGNSLRAAGPAADVISMKNAAYATHAKPVVEFSHKKHAVDYGAKCGDCHHDDKGQPLADLKDGDPVQSCIACHKLPGEVPKEEKKALKSLPPDQKKAKELAYHAEALHMNCKDCHQEHNKAKSLKKGAPGFAPTACNDCHAKAK